MKRTILCLVSALLLVPALQITAQTPAPAAGQKPPSPFVPAPAQNGPTPTIAFDITKADIDFVLKNAPANPPDRQLRVVDMGKYNLGVGIIHRGPTNDKPGAPISVIYHDYTPEVYIITSGSGVLTTGGVIENMRASTGVPNVMNGPSGGGTAGAGASRVPPAMPRRPRRAPPRPAAARSRSDRRPGPSRRPRGGHGRCCSARRFARWPRKAHRLRP